MVLLYHEDIYMEDMQEAPADGPRAKGRLQHLEGAINLLCKTFPGRILIVGASQVAATRAYHRDYAGILDVMFVAARVKTAAEASVLERDGIKYLNELPEGARSKGWATAGWATSAGPLHKNGQGPALSPVERLCSLGGAGVGWRARDNMR